MLSLSLITLSCLLTGTTALSASERTTVLNAHNNFRSQLALGKAVDKNNNAMPKGKNIYQLTYSTSLETSAQNWANGCVFEHSGAEDKGRTSMLLFLTKPLHQL
uniref:SCP domain-containing protein n=1 Tax=Ditylenchus dipsaci TaxID=166011 RepID=A0A915DPQ7_9BILA